MRLYLVHGWGFGPDCFDALAARLEKFSIARADLGFFGEAKIPQFAPGDVLIGHSLGFLWGLSQNRAWAGAVAINGFARFTLDDQGRGCVRASELRALRKFLARDAQACVADFRARHGGGPARGVARAEALATGLDLLETGDAAPGLTGLPILSLAAQDDPLVPLDAARELAQTGDELAVSATGGHGLPWTAPDFCAENIMDFLSRNAQ